MAILKCQRCGKEFKTYRLTDHGRKRKFCTWDCAMKAPWNTTKKGGNGNVAKRPEVIEKFKKVDRSYISGSKNHNWKGSGVGYNSLHSYIYRKYGRPNVCEFCHSANKKRFTWANKDGSYSRKRDNWISLCYSCHIRYDIVNKIRKPARFL